MANYRLISEAKAELTAGVSFYDSEYPGLGPEFAIEVRRLCRLVTKSPAAGLEVCPGVRRRILRRFPIRFSTLWTTTMLWSSQWPIKVEDQDIGIVVYRHLCH